MPDILFNAEKLKLFKQAVADAKAAGLYKFKFEGHDFLVVYAEYLIEYLELLFRAR